MLTRDNFAPAVLATFIVTLICFYVPGFVHAVASGNVVDAIICGGVGICPVMLTLGNRKGFQQ